MASVSLSLPKGADGLRASDFTTGVLAQNAGDIELRFTSSLSKKELLIALADKPSTGEEAKIKELLQKI